MHRLSRRLRVYPGDTCWSCHTPARTPGPTGPHRRRRRRRPVADGDGDAHRVARQPTPTPTETPSACSQECHLWDSAQKQYIVPFTHGDNPHLGLDARVPRLPRRGALELRPRPEPAPQRQATGFTKCGGVPLLAAEARRQGRLHHVPHERAGIPPVPGEQPRATRSAASCHTMKHAGKKVSTRASARSCHKGTSRPSGAALLEGHQEVRLQRLPQAEALHASPVSREVKSCRTCHTRQVPRRSAHAAGKIDLHQVPRRPPPPRQRLPVHPVPPRAVHNSTPNVGGGGDGGGTSGGYNGLSRY